VIVHERRRAPDVLPRPATWRTVALLAAVTGLAVLPYLAGVLVPYYANGLDELSLAEVASGRHDPKELWPQGVVGGWLQVAGFFSLALTPVGVLVALAGSVAALVRDRRRSGVALGLLTVAAACVAVLVFFATPLGGALATWRLD
jgi:hypothetical protein